MHLQNQEIFQPFIHILYTYTYLPENFQEIKHAGERQFKNLFDLIFILFTFGYEYGDNKNILDGIN